MERLTSECLQCGFTSLLIMSGAALSFSAAVYLILVGI